MKEPGALVSAAYVNTIGAPAILQAMGSSESRIQTGITPRYGVASYKLTYYTVDESGAAQLASGLVSLPLKAAGAKSPLLSYQHATTFKDAFAPTNKVEAVEPPIVLSSLGYIVLSPDNVGFGASKGVEHPYLTSTPTARAVIDLLTAAQTWRSQNGVADNGQLFLAGYSEGGYATMAAQRAIELAGGALKTQLQATVPGAGPYDVQETLDEQLRRVRAANPVLGALLSPGWLRYAGDTVRNEVRRLLLRQMLPEDSDVAYQTLFLDRYMADDKTAIARDHSVHLGWVPSVPVHLFHGRGDQTVPFTASESALRTLLAAGARQVTLTECSDPTANHTACVPEYFRFAVGRMGLLARDL